MVVLQIEHPVPNFADWKQAFDSDPSARKESGVRRYRILRPVDNPNFAVIELEFDHRHEAEALLSALLRLITRVEGTLMTNLRYRIVEVIDTLEY